MRTALFRVITQRVVVIPYRRFGTTCRSHHSRVSWPLKMGPISCPEASVNNYQPTVISVVVKALRYKSEGPGIDSRCRRFFFFVASDSSMCPGVDSASENVYQVNPGGKGGRCVRLTTYHIHVPMSRNLGALTSWNPVGRFRPVMGQLYNGH
jgi:hypothetical protein